MELETQRLLLRPWQDSDAPDLYLYAKDPRVGIPAGWPPHSSVENSREIIRTILSERETYAVIWKETGQAIGSVGLKFGEKTDLTDREDEAEIGYWLGVPFWGRGIMPEAVSELTRYGFEEFKLKKIWCGWYEGNINSKRVQEKCGFHHHHTTERVYVEALGEYRKGHVSLLTRDEWKG